MLENYYLWALNKPVRIVIWNTSDYTILKHLLIQIMKIGFIVVCMMIVVDRTEALKTLWKRINFTMLRRINFTFSAPTGFPAVAFALIRIRYPSISGDKIDSVVKKIVEKDRKLRKKIYINAAVGTRM